MIRRPQLSKISWLLWTPSSVFTSFIDLLTLNLWRLQLWLDISGSVLHDHCRGDLLPLPWRKNLSGLQTLKYPRYWMIKKQMSSCSSANHRLLGCRCSLNSEIVKTSLWLLFPPYGEMSWEDDSRRGWKTFCWQTSSDRQHVKWSKKLSSDS